MRDRGPSVLLRPVSNLGILSSSAEDAQRRLDGIIRDFESFGLIVHETEISTGKIQTLGVELDCAELATRVTRAQRSRLRSALKAFCRRRTATGEMLQVIIGHCTSVVWCGGHRSLLPLLSTRSSRSMARSGRRFGILANESFGLSAVCCRFCRPLGAHPGALPVTASTLHFMVGEFVAGDGTPASFEALVASASGTASGRRVRPAHANTPLPKDVAQSTTRRRVSGLALLGPRRRQAYRGRSAMSFLKYPRKSLEENGRRSVRVLGVSPSPSHVSSLRFAPLSSATHYSW